MLRKLERFSSFWIPVESSKIDYLLCGRLFPIASLLLVYKWPTLWKLWPVAFAGYSCWWSSVSLGPHGAEKQKSTSQLDVYFEGLITWDFSFTGDPDHFETQVLILQLPKQSGNNSRAQLHLQKPEDNEFWTLVRCGCQCPSCAACHRIKDFIQSFIWWYTYSVSSQMMVIKWTCDVFVWRFLLFVNIRNENCQAEARPFCSSYRALATLASELALTCLALAAVAYPSGGPLRLPFPFIPSAMVTKRTVTHITCGSQQQPLQQQKWKWRTPDVVLKEFGTTSDEVWVHLQDGFPLK